MSDSSMAASTSSPIAAASAADGNCAVCLDELSGTCGRTIVTLQCAHKFHLDCIGSTFNSFGEMRCPLCRAVENGTWTISVETASDLEEEEAEHDELECLEYLDAHPHPYQTRLVVSSSPMSMICALFQQQPAVIASVHANHSSRFNRQDSASHDAHQLYRDWNQPGSGLLSFASNESQAGSAYQTRLPYSSHSEGALPAAFPFTSMANQAVTANASVTDPVVLRPGSSSGTTHCNVPWFMDPCSNSPSPGVQATMSCQVGHNGSPEGVPANNASSGSEQIVYLFNVPLNAPRNQEQPESPMVTQAETLRTRDFGRSGDSSNYLDLNMKI